jgi:hypothetical protein
MCLCVCAVSTAGVVVSHPEETMGTSEVLPKHVPYFVPVKLHLSLCLCISTAGVVVPHPEETMPALALKPGSVRHYVEFHIEQGPQLEAAGLALGVVSGIAGQTWLSVSVEGVQNHGGGYR